MQKSDDFRGKICKAPFFLVSLHSEMESWITNEKLLSGG